MGKKLFIFVVVLLTAFSCRTIKETTDQYHEKDSVRIEYVYNIDSVYKYVRDSIYIHEKGDTVFIDKWHIRYQDRWREKHDSIKVTVETTDSVYISKDVEVPYVPKFYKTCTWLWWIVVVLIVLWIAWKLFKKFYLHK